MKKDQPKGDEVTVQAQNNRGEWVPAIPEPFYLREVRKDKARRGKVRCDCGRVIKGYENYRGHYALVHILALA
jgi:hypothetical protein